MNDSNAQRLKRLELEAENGKLKRLLAHSVPELDAMRKGALPAARSSTGTSEFRAPAPR